MPLPHRREVVGLLGLALLVAPLAGDARITRTGTAAVTFTAVGPGGLSIVGRSRSSRSRRPTERCG